MRETALSMMREAWRNSGIIAVPDKRKAPGTPYEYGLTLMDTVSS